MKRTLVFLSLIFLVFNIFATASEDEGFPVLKGPYLGQNPPGMTPKVFAPGILNTDKTGAFCTVFSPDGNEFYFTFYLRADESYMIISLWDHPGNIGSSKGDLYVTFKKKDGTWTEEINMGEAINMRCGENCPMVSPDGKYFFFNRYCEDLDRGDMYWVDAKIIDTYRPKDVK